jgi:glycosyltransferase involved in cell wall biosynthesis
MKILWINHRDPHHPQAGGAEVRLMEISKRLVKKGHDITLLCERWSGSQKHETIEGVEIVRSSGKYGIHLKVPFLLNQYRDYDLVIDDVAHAVPWYSPLFTSKPVVCQVHHVHQDVLRFELNPLLSTVVSLSERSVKIPYKNILTVSQSTKTELIRRFGIAQNRIRIIPNGVDSKYYSPGEKSSYPTILSVGRLKRYKRVDHIIRAFKIVNNSVPNAKLIVVGDGEHIDQLRSLVNNERIVNVEFKGKVSDDEKKELMASSWLSVTASTAEGWGMTILENAACGTPCVAYDVAGVSDSIQNGRTGILVEDGNITALADGVMQLINDEPTRLSLGSAAVEYAKLFDWDYIAREFVFALEGLYESNNNS